MRVLKYHGDVGGAWLALDKAAWRFLGCLGSGLERIHYVGGLERSSLGWFLSRSGDRQPVQPAPHDLQGVGGQSVTW